MEKSLTIYRYIKKIIVGKPFLKPLPHRNPLPHFTYSIFDPPCFPAKPIRLKKKKKTTLRRSASAVLQLWDFDTSHNLRLITQQKYLSPGPEVSKVSLHICLLETTPYPTTPTPTPPPVPTRASVQCWRWLVTWPSALRHHSSASDSGSDGPVCLSGLGIIFFYTYIYKNREVCTRTVITAALYMPLFWHPHSFFHRLTRYLPPNYL